MSRLQVETDAGLTAVDWFTHEGRAYVDVAGGGQACVSDDGVYVRSGLWTATSLEALAKVCQSGPVAESMSESARPRLTVVG